jgi:hypothetical protein
MRPISKPDEADWSVEHDLGRLNLRSNKLKNVLAFLTICLELRKYAINCGQAIISRIIRKNSG